MPRRGRPKRPTGEYKKFVVSLWCIRETEADIIDYLESIPKGHRSNRVKEHIRSGISGTGLDLVPGEDDDLITELSGLSDDQRVKRVKRLMRQGLEVESQAGDQSDDEKSLGGLLDL